MNTTIISIISIVSAILFIAAMISSIFIERDTRKLIKENRERIIKDMSNPEISIELWTAYLRVYYDNFEYLSILINNPKFSDFTKIPQWLSYLYHTIPHTVLNLIYFTCRDKEAKQRIYASFRRETETKNNATQK